VGGNQSTPRKPTTFDRALTHESVARIEPTNSVRWKERLRHQTPKPQKFVNRLHIVCYKIQETTNFLLLAPHPSCDQLLNTAMCGGRVGVCKTICSQKNYLVFFRFTLHDSIKISQWSWHMFNLPERTKMLSFAGKYEWDIRLIELTSAYVTQFSINLHIRYTQCNVGYMWVKYSLFDSDVR
jgi:hypothetical protein